MTDPAFEALRDAVTVARDEQVRSVTHLVQRLRERGHTPEAIQEALTRWGVYARKSGA